MKLWVGFVDVALAPVAGQAVIVLATAYQWPWWAAQLSTCALSLVALWFYLEATTAGDES